MTPTHAQKLGRRWGCIHRVALNQIGTDSLHDTPGTVYTIDTLTFAVFKNIPARCQYWLDLCDLAERRGAECMTTFVIDEHKKRVRQFCREQIVLPPARRSRVMFEVDR